VNNTQKQIFEKRALNIIKNSKEDFKTISVDLELHRAFSLSAAFARNQLTFINSFKKFSLLKYFVQDPYRWNILNYIIYFSAKKEPIYLEKLKRYIHKSDRHVEKVLKDCLANGSFIILDPHDKVLKNKKIVSIRPSEKLMKEFFGHNILKYRKFINIIKRFNFK
jgi:ribosomal protein L22